MLADAGAADGGFATPPTVVAADDSPEMRELLKLILERLPAHVVEVSDGEEALGAMRAHRPRVAVLDMGMPRCSGWEVIAQVRRDPALAGTRVLLISGDHDVERLAREAGADGGLAKPFRPRDLLDAVRELLG